MERSLHILLVEDHADSRAFLTRLLEKSGYHVCEAETVTAALAAAEKKRFDVLIADLGLPDGSGLDLMRQLRCRNQIPAVAVTGCDDLEASRAAGFDAHVTKPISFPRLLEVIRDLTEPGPRTRLAS